MVNTLFNEVISEIEKKFRKDILKTKSPSPTPGSLAQGSSARKISPHNSGCKNQQGLSWGKKLPESQEVPLKKPQTYLLRLTSSEYQHEDSTLKENSGLQGGDEVSGTKCGSWG